MPVPTPGVAPPRDVEGLLTPVGPDPQEVVAGLVAGVGLTSRGPGAQRPPHVAFPPRATLPAPDPAPKEDPRPERGAEDLSGIPLTGGPSGVRLGERVRKGD